MGRRGWGRRWRGEVDEGVCGRWRRREREVGEKERKRKGEGEEGKEGEVGGGGGNLICNLKVFSFLPGYSGV